MSVKVDLGELAEHMRHYGFAYLLTVGDDQRAHAIAVRPTLDGATVDVAGLGRTSRANVEARPDISLVWPPFEPGGYSLIVDGGATLTSDGASIAPDHAVLHRSADGAAQGSSTGAGHDCIPIGDA